MSLKHVVVAFALVFLLAITWRVAQSDWAQGARSTPAAAPVPIRFDNGTVRQYDDAAAVAARNKGQPLPLGRLRKCQRGAELSYTNSFCPPGTQELAVNRGTVNVMEAGPAAPAAAADAPAPQRTLRELAIERAVDHAGEGAVQPSGRR